VCLWNELAGQGKDKPGNFCPQGEPGRWWEHWLWAPEQGRGEPAFIERLFRVSATSLPLWVKNFQGVSYHPCFRMLPEGLDYELNSPLQRHIVSIQQNNHVSFGSIERSIQGRTLTSVGLLNQPNSRILSAPSLDYIA
jgi:hypothetical protein